MIRVPGGAFAMGSLPGVGDDDEHPQHPVAIGSYCIDRTEVTVAAYSGCVARGACTAALEPADGGRNRLCNGNRADRQDHPVNCVDWYQAEAYCASLGKRLPREAEWEFAASGGDSRRYPWGDEPPSAARLNACGGECRALGERLGLHWKVMYEASDGWEATAPVGSFAGDRSQSGALDMAGNVVEWTADWHAPYDPAPITDPRGPETGRERVARGSGWYTSNPSWVRPAIRFWGRPGFRDPNLGLRCAR